MTAKMETMPKYSQGMRRVADFFGRMATYGTYIQYAIMTETTKIIPRKVKVNTGDAEIENMLLGKELLEWVQHTRKLSENMGKDYKVILR